MNNLRWVAPFIVSTEISAKFQKWMRKHFKDLENTGHFEEKVREIVQENAVAATDQAPAFDSIVYIHTPKSREAWKAYNENDRADLKEDFKENWGWAITGEKLIPGQQTMDELAIVEK